MGSPRPRSPGPCRTRSEEHTSELQSQSNLVCRLLLEKKKKTTSSQTMNYKSSSSQTTRHRQRESIYNITPTRPTTYDTPFRRPPTRTCARVRTLHAR